MYIHQSPNFPCKKSYVSFVNVFKINVLKVIIYRKGSVSKVNVSKCNELKGKVSKKSVSSKPLFSPFEKQTRSENCLFLFHLCTSRTLISTICRVNISFLTESEVKLFNRGTCSTSTRRKGKIFEDEIEPL